MKNEKTTIDLSPEEDITHWPYEHRYKLRCDVDMFHELSCEELKSNDLIIPMYNKLFEEYKDDIISITELAVVLFMKTAESVLMSDFEAFGIYNSSLIKTEQYIRENYTEDDIAYYNETIKSLEIIKRRTENDNN